jgi:RNA polymerase sigma factor (TIGR02999 family)
VTAEVTQLLRRWAEGDAGARDELLPLVYDELRAVAARHLARERRAGTLQATALVHEAYLKLVDHERMQWQGRAHFFAVAAQVIRRILVDHARSRSAQKRGGDGVRVELDDDLPVAERGLDLLRLDDALSRLARLDPTQGRLVELRYFGGLTLEETAEVLGSSPATVKREWSFARAWLRRELAAEAS